jgi:restriction system protein
MNVIVWLVVIAGLIGLIGMAGIWLLRALGVVLKGASDTAELGATSFLDVLGKKRLMQLFETPKDLVELEGKLAVNDLEKLELKRYSPQAYAPQHLEDIKYVEELPKLFKRSQSAISIIVNIEDIKSLMSLSATPAHELLKVVSEESPPKFPLPPIKSPRPITPPTEFSEWGCNMKEYEVVLPVYKGVFKPLNYFVRKSFKKAIDQVEELRLRQTVAMTKAKERNLEVAQLYKEALTIFERAKQKQNDLWADLQLRERIRLDEFFAAYKQEKQELDRLVEAAKSNSPNGLIARIEQTLKLENFPKFVPSEFAIRLDQASRILILEHEFPDIGGVSWIKLVSQKSGLTVKPANQKEVKDAATLIYPALSLRLACEIARLDTSNLLEAIVVNGWSNYTEKSTGQVKRAYCTSLFATKDQLLSLNLSAADPLAAFAALKGVAARSLELTPIAPILRLNTEDKRFVDAKEILENMSQGENLAAMDWEDFEHLCRQLFEKAFAESGAEVKVTQASRDQGVDAVIFDPDVLRGGKIVVQAKRYTNTVDVSAVRDLYGAVINEGATKGILVTTSHYGPDAYGFAKDKPLTLLNGQELLGLLQKYGYTFRIDLTEAKRINAANGFKF